MQKLNFHFLVIGWLAKMCFADTPNSGNCKIKVRRKSFKIPFATLEKLDENSFLRVACFNDPESQEPIPIDRDPELFSVISAYLNGADVTTRIDVDFNNLGVEADFYGLTDLSQSIVGLAPRKRKPISRMIKKTPAEMLFASCKSGNVNLFERAILSNSHDMSAFLDHEGRLPLSVAAIHGKKEVAGLLLQYGASVDAVDKLGQTALMHAAINGHVETIELLASKGADIDLQDKEGHTALMHAVINGKVGIVNEVLKFCRTVDGQDRDGYTALMHAARQNRVDLLASILYSGRNPNVNLLNRVGETLFLVGARYGNRSTVEYLCHQDVTSISYKIHYLPGTLYEATPFVYALQRGNQDAANIISNWVKNKDT